MAYFSYPQGLLAYKLMSYYNVQMINIIDKEKIKKIEQVQDFMATDTKNNGYADNVKAMDFFRSINDNLFTEQELISVFADKLISNIEDTPTEEDNELEIRKTFIKNKVKGTYDLAKYLTNKYHMITVGRRDREIYVYQNGLYTRAENEVILPEIQRILQDHTTKNAKTETIHKIQDFTSKNRSIFESTDVKYIPLLNGVYDSKEKVLLPHSPDYHFKYQIPITYNKDSVCPKINAFFDQIFTEVQRATMEEWLGYCFYRNYMFKKAVIMVGEGDTGKTTFLELLSSLVGYDNKSGISLHRISGDKFAAAQLYEKHVNIYDELSDEDVHDTANFKIATGGGSIMGEYKFGDQFSFKNFSKLLFACNRIPDVKNMSDEAYFNRWMVIHMEKTIPVKVSNFINTLTTKEELSGLFNLAMIGLERLLTNDGFSYKYSGIDTKLEMMRSSSSLAMFVTDKLYKDIGSEVSKEKLYDAYLTYCEEASLPPETIIMVGKKLMFLATYISEGRAYDYVNGRTSQIKTWRNVSIRLSEEEQREKDRENEDIERLLENTAKAITIKSI